MKDRIDKVMEGLRQAIIDDTCALTEIESPYGDAAGCNAALDFVLARAKEFGMRTGKTTGNDVCWAEVGQGDELVGILAHVDVVEPGDLAKWTDPPYKAVIRDGRIYGRGTEDDKGPVIASLYAMRALQLMDIPLKKRVRLIVGTCEEGVWTDIPHYREQFETPDYGFSPDAAFPIYNVESGYCDAELHFTEDNWDAVELLDAGQSTNSIPSLAEVSIKGKGKAAYHGVASHSAMPELADNAITKMCKNDPDLAATNVAKFVTRFFAEAPSAVVALGIDDGTDQYQGEAAGLTLANPTVLKREGRGAKLNVNLRQKYGTTRADIEGAFGRFAEEYRYTLAIPDFMDPMRTSQNLPPYQLMDRVQKAYGMEGGFKSARGSTYAKSMPGFVSWGPTLPGVESVAHVEDEYFDIDTMILSAKMTAHWLAETAGPQG